MIITGALGGRLDHTLSNLNTLYCFRHLNMALWGDGNLVRLLRAGRATIHPARCEGPTCGLVPLARPATASSTGLKWDLDNTHVSWFVCLLVCFCCCLCVAGEGVWKMPLLSAVSHALRCL